MRMKWTASIPAVTRSGQTGDFVVAHDIEGRDGQEAAEMAHAALLRNKNYVGAQLFAQRGKVVEKDAKN